MTMLKLVDNTVVKYQQLTKEDVKQASTPGTLGWVLAKTGQALSQTAHSLYKTMTEKLMYLAQKTMPEVFNAVRELASHINAPGDKHVIKMRRTVGYVKPVQHNLLVLQRLFKLQSISKTNSNFATNAEDQKSVTGHLHMLGGIIANWAFQKQKTVTLSSTKAEYIALA